MNMLQYAGCCRIKVVEVIEVIEVEESQEVQKPRSPEVETSLLKTLQFSTSVEVELYRQNVTSWSVGPLTSYDISRRRILLIFGQKLEDKILRLLTEPDYPKKIWIIQ